MNTKGIRKESQQTSVAPFLYKEVRLEIFLLHELTFNENLKIHLATYKKSRQS